MQTFMTIIGVLLGSVSITMTNQNGYDEYNFPNDCKMNERRPNLLDPHSFYWCHVYGPVLMRCMAGTFFDVTVGRCTEESKAPLDIGYIQSVTVKLPEDEGKLRCPQPKSPPRGVRCPASDPIKYSLYFPDPKACDCFYQCDNGTAKRIPCRKDLHFNSTTNLCDWPEEAGCIVQ